jgi:hypothetical protein
MTASLVAAAGPIGDALAAILGRSAIGRSTSWI